MNEQKKHILFFPRWYPNRYDPMWGLFVKKHAQAASIKNNISVLYLEAVDEGIDSDEIVEETDGEIDTLYIYYSKPRNRILYFIKFIQMYFRGLKIIRKKNKVDLIHVHILSRNGFLAYLSFLFNGIPYLITEHWSRYLPSVNHFNGKIRIFLTQFVVKRAKAVLPVTENLKKAMKSHGLYNSKYYIIPNVVDDFFFNSNKIKIESSRKRVIHVSTFEDKSKNISGIIKAVRKISLDRQDFTMVFVGDGMDFNAMKNLAEELQIDRNLIEFTGLLEKEELLQQYRMALFMLINSNYENMPVVINEAMASGLPVLSTDVGGINEHLDSSKGVLFPPQSEEELIQLFNWMLDHAEEFDSKEISNYARNHFSLSGIGEKLDHIYKECLNHK